MTIPYIARTYHVPEDYLYQWLHITDRQKPVHATLRLLAARYHRSVNSMIQSVQAAIRAYRAQHPARKTSESGVAADVATVVGLVYPQGDTGHLRRIVLGGRTPTRGNAGDLQRIVMGGRTPARDNASVLQGIGMGGRTPARDNASVLQRIGMGGRTPARGHPTLPTAPVPTMLRSPFCTSIVGTGVGLAQVGFWQRPSLPCHAEGKEASLVAGRCFAPLSMTGGGRCFVALSMTGGGRCFVALSMTGDGRCFVTLSMTGRGIGRCKNPPLKAGVGWMWLGGTLWASVLVSLRVHWRLKGGVVL